MLFTNQITEESKGEFRTKVTETESGFSLIIVVDSMEKANAAIPKMETTVVSLLEQEKYSNSLKWLTCKRINLRLVTLLVRYGKQVENEYHVYFTKNSFQVNIKDFFGGLTVLLRK